MNDVGAWLTVPEQKTTTNEERVLRDKVIKIRRLDACEDFVRK